MYRNPVSDINYLDRIAAVIVTVVIDVMQRARMELLYHFDTVRVTDGVHVECL